MKKLLTRLILLLIMVLALVPFGSSEIKMDNLGDLNVDVAFQLALPYFLEQHFQFGEQLVFTYGPWGILLSVFSGSDYDVVTLLFRICLAVSVFLALCILIDRHNDRVSKIVTWGGVLTLVSLWVTGHRDSYFLFPALLVIYHTLTTAVSADEKEDTPARRTELILWVMLSLLSGWLALAKFNIFIVATVGYLLIFVVDIKRRRWPVLPLVYTTSLLLAWLAAGQNLANLPLWISLCFDLSLGYTDAMAKGFFIPYTAVLIAVFYASVTMIMLTAFISAVLHQWSLPAFLLLLFTLFICAVSVKHGMGGNQLEQALVSLIAILWFVGQTLLLSSTYDSEKHTPLWKRFGLITSLVAIVGLAFVASKANFPIRSPKDSLADIQKNLLLLPSALSGTDDTWQTTLQGFNRLWVPPVSSTKQTVDVYPHQNGLVIDRKGFQYAPRPAFLSLNAHTYKLAKLNALHIEGKTAPDLILFRVQPSVNNRHPALTDGPSWPLLLSRYTPGEAGEDFLLLKKRQQPLFIDKQLVLEKSMQIGETISLPYSERELLWAEVEMQRSLAGSLVNLLFKSPHIMLESYMGDKTKHSFQIVPELGRAGFLISPLVLDNATFSKLYQNKDLSDEHIKSIIISSPEAPDFFWNKTFKIKIYALNIVNVRL